MANLKQPIIVIKKVHKGGHAHHGGSWKVAFADFVTAMMAFFMLMWLLGSTTPEERSGISDFFNNPSAIAGPGGASTSMIKNGGEMDVSMGDGPNKLQHSKPGEVKMDSASSVAAAVNSDTERLEKEKHKMESLLGELKETTSAGQALAPFKDHLLLDITSEGLRIQVVDKKNRSMFDNGSDQLKGYTKVILREIATVINKSENRISITGHTDVRPYANNGGHSNWELSTERANAARRELVNAGLADNKIARIVGLGASVLFNKEDPYDPINRRISIVMMNKATDDGLTGKVVARNSEVPVVSQSQLLLTSALLSSKSDNLGADG